MAEYTTKYNLIKPSPQDFVDITKLNENSDKIDAAISTVEETANAALLTASSAGGGIIKENVKIAISGWVADSGGGYVADVEIAEARATMYPIVTVHPTSRDAAVAAGTSSVCETLDGKIRFHAENIPTADVYATVALIVHGGTGGGTGGAAYIPIAGADTLGGIKIGDGLSIETDGTASVDIEAQTATDEEVAEMIERVFGKS